MANRCGYSFAVLLLLTTLAAPQTAGSKGVYNSSGNVAPSQVWIDASAFWFPVSGTLTIPDICNIISQNILTSSYPTNYPNGAVIDARGLYNPTIPLPPKGPITCTGTPFDNFTGSVSPPPTTILLPAASIKTTKPWILPNSMKIVGEELNTEIDPQGTGAFDAIDMGSSTLCNAPCSGISVEHLVIDGSSNPNANGIVNNYAQSSSYVNDVSFNNIGCASLVINAPNSGPYTTINSGFSPTGVVGTGCSGGGTEVIYYPLCIDIEAQTKGVHGVTCIGPPLGATGPYPHTAGIYVNASNNTVEDLHFERYWDGVEIGNVPSAGVVTGVVVSNANGGEDRYPQPIENIVHICGSISSSSGNEGACTSFGTVADVSVLQSTYVGSSWPAGATSVQDDVTGTSIQVTSTPTTGMYALGEPTDSGNSRFSTSPSAVSTSSGAPTAPTWGVGSDGAIGGQTCVTPGSLYSNTGGGTGMSVFVCTSGNHWMSIP